ncbi:hypothetical protein EKD04_013955 [Chloroflexales bacterium ZM16-3]|nr:hypothetical protein [Chloroflexales bacterium ZM16-3]
MPLSTKRPTAAAIEADRALLVALQDVIDYAPINPAYSVPALRTLDHNLAIADEAEIRARRAYEVAREQAAEAARLLHSAALETKAQVVAQYGSNSPVVHAVGLKQRSERKRPVRRTAAA